MADEVSDVFALAEEAKKKGNAYYKDKAYEDAIVAYGEAITLQPNHPTYWLNRSLALRQLERWAEAEQDAARCIELQPMSVKAIFGRAVCLLRMKSFLEAMQVVDSGLSLEADNPALRQIRNDIAQELAKEPKRCPEQPVASQGGPYQAHPPPNAPARQRSVSSSSDASSSSSECGAGANTMMFAEYMAAQQLKKSREATAEELPCQQLQDCASAGNVDECQRLIEAGIVKDINWSRPQDGNTALHLAAEGEHSRVVKLLVTSGADPEAVNDFGLKPVSLAVKGSSAYKVLDKLTAKLCEEARRGALKR